jgi:uncharacterized protein (DUF4415 family)
MKKIKLKPISKKLKAEMQIEFDKGFDFSKFKKKGIFINLDEEVIAYFKTMALEYGRGYQSLIQDALLYFKENKLKPKTSWEEIK